MNDTHGNHPMVPDHQKPEPDQILKITSQDGHQFQILCYDREINPEAPIVLIWPAMGTKARNYKLLAETLRQQGYHGMVGELRGHGSSSQRASHRCDFGYKELVQYDWHMAVTRLQEHYPQAPIYLLGHSLGGQLSLLYAAAFKQHIAGVMLVASCSVYYRSYGAFRGTAFRGLLTFIWPMVRLLGYFPGDTIGFARREGARLSLDWAYQGKTGKYRSIGDPTRYEQLLHEMNLPVLCIEIKNDTLAVKPAVTHLLKKLQSATIKRECLEVPESRPGYEHFDWFKFPEKVVAHIHTWLSATGTRML